MTELVKATKHSVWKYFGAMFMEEKNGEMAVSWTRFLGILTFAAWFVLIILQALKISEIEVPTELTIGMGSFAGIKGIKDFGLAIKGKLE